MKQRGFTRTRLVVTRGIRKAFLALLLTFSANSLIARNHIADSQKSFDRAVDAAAPGDTIAIAAGRYNDWEIYIDAKGAEGAAITIEPEQPGTVIFTGTSPIEIAGERIHFKRFAFEDFEMEDQSRFNSIRPSTAAYPIFSSYQPRATGRLSVSWPGPRTTF